MKIGLLMYNGSPLFEVVVAKYILETKYEVVVLSDSEKVCSAEKICFDARLVSSLDCNNDLHAIVICGGDLEELNYVSKIKKIIRSIMDQGGVVASICAGNSLVADALDMESQEGFQGIKLINERVLMASGDYYIQFAIKLGELLDVYIDKDDYMETVDYFLKSQID